MFFELHYEPGTVWSAWGMVYHEQNMRTCARVHTHTHTHTIPMPVNSYSSRKRDTIIKSKRVRSTRDFPDSSGGKESTCNAGDRGSIPGSGRSAGKEIGYPLQYSLASLVAQLVKNLPAMWETWIQPVGWKDPLGKGTATLSSILTWRIPWTV